MSETESHRGLSFLHRMVGVYLVFRFLGRICYGRGIRFAELDGGPARFLQALSARYTDVGSDLRSLMAGPLGFCRRYPQDGVSLVGACTFGICLS